VVRVLLSPRMIGLHLLALVATTAAVWLGLWQYDAWQTRRELAASDLAGAAPKPLDTVMSADDPFPGDAIGQPVELTGVWVAESTFYVAGRQTAGGTGFWVVTPVAVCETSCDPRNAAMPVVRGWTPRTQDAPAAPTGEVELTGWLQPAEGTGRPDANPNDDVLQELRIADAIQQVDQDLYGAYVIAEQDSSGGMSGLEPVTPDSLPEPETFTAVRNLLYAVEWWVFGVFALFVWWRWCSDEVSAGSASGSSSTHEGGGSTSAQQNTDAEVPSSP
jgi:surfeit locus 1 family protein